MRVMHVSLGLPPLRTGGMTRYCTELALAQVAHGDEVALLYPGRFLLGGTRVVTSNWNGIRTYEIVNPLPVSLVYGVAEPERFTRPCGDPGAYACLLDGFAPEVIHVHCFQGIHREFFQLAKERGIPLLFTTHDYYPVCPRCTLITSSGNECDSCGSAVSCAACNEGSGMTFTRSLIMQSRAYALLKSSRLVAVVGRYVKTRMSRAVSRTAEGVSEKDASVGEDASTYERMLAYNRSIFGLFDLILANSRPTEQMYRKWFPDAAYVYLPITHAGLVRQERVSERGAEGRTLKVAYFGGEKHYKGFDTLLDAVRILEGRGVSIELNLYGDDYVHCELPSSATARGRLPPDAISAAVRENSVVCVPSRYHETFGFVVLESLCEGVPVICSNAVGASDLVPNDLRFDSGNSESLAQTIEGLLEKGPVAASIPDEYPLSMTNQVLSIERLIQSRFLSDGSDEDATR